MKIYIFLFAFLFAAPAYAAEWVEQEAVSRVFESAGVEGTFVILDVATQQLSGHNAERANTRYVPASTFKIANSLIGLATGAVSSTDEVLPYGGQPQPIKAWEHDMSLREAIKVSNVPVYQQLARRIGLERMRAGVQLLGYGNAQIGEAVDQFWLNGPLTISALEQTEFLARLAQHALPLPSAVQAAVRDITLFEKGPNWKLYAKTGWGDGDPDIGWWVGWVEKDDRLYVFALNIDMPRPELAAQRVELGKAALQALGILEKSISELF